METAVLGEPEDEVDTVGLLAFLAWPAAVAGGTLMFLELDAAASAER